MSKYKPFLKDNMTKYQYVDKAQKDILEALSQYTDLRPIKENFTFNNGITQSLLALEGTLPVTFNNSTYNIPICVFLLETHPYNAPFVYVRPTSTMQIKQSKHVDSNGRIYLPYLTEWSHPKEDLTGLLGVLRLVFGEEPPVYSKPPSVAANTQYGGPRPPVSNWGASPGYPPARPPVSNGTPYGSGWGMPMPQTGGFTGVNNYPPSSTGYSTATISEDQLLISLRTAVEDKVRRNLRDIHAQLTAELEVLQRTQVDLVKGGSTLKEICDSVEKETNDLQRNLSVIEEKNREMESTLGKLTRQETLNIDDAVDTTAPLYRQLLSAFCEEQAIEDAIYYLGEALGKNKIDVETFLKKIRELSRKQFMLRATVQKCREKAGLPAL